MRSYSLREIGRNHELSSSDRSSIASSIAKRPRRWPPLARAVTVETCEIASALVRNVRRADAAVRASAERPDTRIYA
jgi:hypothetical protein